MNYSQLRSSAREALRGKWGLAAGATLVFMILSSLVVVFIFAFQGSPSDPQASSTVTNLIARIWYFFVGGALTLGMAQFALNIVRFRDAQVGDLFSFFRNGHQYKKSVRYAVLTTIYLFLWTLLLIIPGIIKSFSYAMTSYILIDHPDYTVKQAITKSREIMDGHKFELFVLRLTFLGWGILCLFTLGIGFLWLFPYYYVAEAQFYRKITGQVQEDLA